MSEFVRVEAADHILTVTIDREEARNALHPIAMQQMSTAFDEFAADPDLWVAIVTGAGDRAFCAGFDLKHQAKEGANAFKGAPKTGFGGLTNRFDCDKPIIAAVNGLALGGGFEMALACDMIVAAESASFGLPEAKVGTAALGGGIIRLPRLLGPQRALHLLTTGRRVSASELAAWGLVQELAPDGEVVAAARLLAEDICASAPLSVRACKQVVYESMALPLEEALTRRWPALDALIKSEDFREGSLAFAEKRMPEWKGR